MGFAPARVTVSTTAVKLVEGVQAAIAADAPSFLVKNTDATDTVYLGAADVTSSTGYPLAAGESLAVGPLGAGDALYGITASGSAIVATLKVA